MELKAVIHFYLGCPVWICKNIEGLDVIEPLTRKMLYEAIDDGDMFFDPEDPSPYKLILRPLSSMTEEEMKDLCMFEYLYGISFVKSEIIKAEFSPTNPNCLNISYNAKRGGGATYGQEHIYMNKLSPKRFAFLIKNHFDLFDLIVTGQAIDSTKL